MVSANESTVYFSKKPSFISRSAYAMRYFFLKSENMSFSDLRKKYRIAYAERLIEEGFLGKYTVDSLAETIGYSSRTSFYSAYKEVMGKPWQRNNS